MNTRSEALPTLDTDSVWRADELRASSAWIFELNDAARADLKDYNLLDLGI